MVSVVCFAVELRTVYVVFNNDISEISVTTKACAR